MDLPIENGGSFHSFFFVCLLESNFPLHHLHRQGFPNAMFDPRYPRPTSPVLGPACLQIPWYIRAWSVDTDVYPLMGWFLIEG
jgi:hypothetical protein